MRFSSARPRLFALLAPLPLVASVASVGCSNLGGVGLGGDDTDSFKLADAAATAHFQDALDDGDSLTFQQVFERGDGITFSGKPDPSAFLRATNAVDDDRDRQGRAPLTVLTYNVAMLDVNLFGFVPYAETPELETRRQTSPALIFARDADVVLLQEVWLDEDVEEFLRTGEEFGYRGFVHERSGHNDGLVTFIKESAIAGGTTTALDFAAYGSQNTQEYFPGPGIARGWMSVRFIHAEIGAIRVYNTHMQAFSNNWMGRMKQGREIGIIMRTVLEEEGTPDDISLIGGDFNAGPYYKSAEWELPDGAKEDRWFHNTFSYSTMLTYGELVDLAIAGRPAEDAIADVTLGDTVVNDAATALQIPGAREGWCSDTPSSTFTATDCNTLYFDQYAGTEFPARLDHIFGHDPDGRIVASSSEIVFVEPAPFGGTVVEVSDHYGVEVDLLITPKR